MPAEQNSTHPVPQEKIKQQKEHEAWLRKKHAEDKELYRQEVLLRSVVLEAQKMESARAKEADLGVKKNLHLAVDPSPPVCQISCQRSA